MSDKGIYGEHMVLLHIKRGFIYGQYHIFTLDWFSFQLLIFGNTNWASAFQNRPVLLVCLNGTSLRSGTQTKALHWYSISVEDTGLLVSHFYIDI